MRLNIGCGAHYVDGWTNIDTSTHVTADVYASILDLPYPDDSADLVYCGHVLEHIPEQDVPAALREVERVSNGEMMFVGPDYDRALAMHQMGQISEEVFQGVIHGGCQWPGDEHYWLCTEDELLKKLTETLSPSHKFIPMSIQEVNGPWPVTARVGWQCAVAVR